MRLLVSCPDCKRRYDATRLGAGKRFRCRCGTVVTAHQPRSHDASVVRCSSCGAARDKRRRSCSHCGSDFTLHERDLHTVCPECFTRVSDKAKYCHSCGTFLSAEEEMGEETTLQCPACVDEPHLHSRQLGTQRISALECDRCAGLWVGVEAFEHLTRQAHQVASPSVVLGHRRASHIPASPPPQRSGYRPCPYCKKLMNRRNYGLRYGGGGGSGAVVDLCAEHGIWFDTGELAHILDWLRQGGRPEDITRPDHLLNARRQPRTRRRSRETIATSGPLFSRDIFDSAFSSLGSLFSIL